MPTIPHAAHLVALLALLSHAAAQPTRPVDPFRVDDRPPTSAALYASAEPIQPDHAASPMLTTLSGHLMDLESADIVALRRSLGTVVSDADLPDAKTLGIIHLSRSPRTAPSAARVEILIFPSTADDPARYAARPLDIDAPVRWLNTQAVERLALHSYMRSDEHLPPNARTSFVGNADPSPITLDRATRRRIFRANYPELTRDLADETIHIRTPPGFDSSTPTGILVWISPTPDGRIPPLFEPALDELNLVAVGASNAGNTRQLSDRLQLMLDAIHTARQRMNLDEQRIYVTGMSGGGRCSGILQISMPDIFSGAVPIVGLDSYHNVPTGNGNTRWPARIGKPPAPTLAILKQHRIRAVTGDQDFNEPEMSRRTEMMQRDGINIEIDVIPGMAHVMPTPAQFANALRWVDQPRRDELTEQAEAAQALLDSIPPAGSPSLDPDTRRARLIEVTILAPWSKPAWEAARHLGFEHQ